MKLDWTEPNASADTSASTSKHSGVDAVDETDKMNTSDLNYDMQVRTCENGSLFALAVGAMVDVADRTPI